MRFITLAVLSLCADAGFAQPFNEIKITIGNANDVALQSKAYLFGYYINARKIVDSANGGNTVLLKLNDTTKGLYNVMVYTDLKDVNGKYQRITFDAIATGSNINFKVAINEDHSLGAVTASGGENPIYNNHFRTNHDYDIKEKTLESTLKQYPKDDAYYPQLEAQLKKVKQEHTVFLQSPCDAPQNPYACFYLKAIHAADNRTPEEIDFTDVKLKDSPFIPAIVWSYLNEINNDSTLAPAVKTEKLKERLDKILTLLARDSEVYGRMLDEIVKSYEMTGKNEIALYLNGKYRLPAASEEDAEKIGEKNEVLESLEIGKPAPDIELTVMGFKQKLYDIEGNYVLLLFWDTDCPHCQKAAGELIDFYHQHKKEGFEVVALALNDSEKVWLNYISENNLDWLNFLEPGGWQGKAPRDYNIQGTPSMFLLDKNKVIVAKPVDVNELKGLTF